MRSIADQIAALKSAAEARAKAEQDPAVQAKQREAYADKLVDLPEVRRLNREREWRARGIPERLWPMLHDGAPGEQVGPLAPKPSPALDAAARFLVPAETRTFLVLAGPVGSGKTVAAAWAAAWSSGRLVKALDLVRAGLYPDDHAFWPTLHGEKLLVIDDAGVEPLDAKGYGLAAVVGLFDRRYDAARKTILTTNLTLEAFRPRFGERVWRRLGEAGTWVDLKARQP